MLQQNMFYHAWCSDFHSGLCKIGFFHKWFSCMRNSHLFLTFISLTIKELIKVLPPAFSIIAFFVAKRFPFSSSISFALSWYPFLHTLILLECSCINIASILLHFLHNAAYELCFLHCFFSLLASLLPLMHSSTYCWLWSIQILLHITFQFLSYNLLQSIVNNLFLKSFLSYVTFLSDGLLHSINRLHILQTTIFQSLQSLFLLANTLNSIFGFLKFSVCTCGSFVLIYSRLPFVL